MRTRRHAGASTVNDNEGVEHETETFVARSLSAQLVDCSCRRSDRFRLDATNYPNRPIRIVVPFPAGGPSDVLARIIGQRISEDWKQPVLIENRVGANTVIGAQAVATAPGDGYTLLMAIALDADDESISL